MYEYIKATGITDDSISRNELLTFIRELDDRRNDYIRDALYRITTNFYSHNKYPTEINNPLTYKKVYEMIDELREYNEGEIKKFLDENGVFLNHLTEEDEEYYNNYKVCLRRANQRLEIIKLLFDRYCETNWEGVI